MTVEKKAQLIEDDISFSVDGFEIDESFGPDDNLDVSFSEDDEDKDDEDEDKSDKSNKDKDSESEESKESKESDDIDGGDIVVLELPGDDEITFTVPDIPGALDMSDIPEPEEVIEVKEEEEKEIDPWDWKAIGGHAGFLNWLQDMVNKTPQHSGHDVSGLDRAMAYIELLTKEIPKAMRSDFKGEIDVNNCEGMADSLYKSLDLMEDRKKRLLTHKYPNRFGKKNKKAGVDESGAIVKEAQKATNIVGVTLVVPLFISRIARTMVNGMISAGHSMEDQYDQLKKAYDLTIREEAELQQLLADMGYPMYQDRGMLNEQVDKSRSDNFDWAANYNG